ncbi:MAG: acetyl-CoA hydrolase, partial [Candidatus Hodarchaeota archaeon]
MTSDETISTLDEMKHKYQEKFISEKKIFSHIHRGDRIFIHTGCGEPQYLVHSLASFIESHPKAFFDAEVFHVWTLGVAPYTDSRFTKNFRHNSFFIGDPTRDSINAGLSDYTPVFLSNTPSLFYQGLVPLDVALIQCSPPDEHGYVNLGVSVDITKAATEIAPLVIAQINSYVPRVHGDGFIHLEDIDYAIVHNEPILEYDPTPTNDEKHNEISDKIGNYVSKLVQDGDTIQVGYGSIPDAVM